MKEKPISAGYFSRFFYFSLPNLNYPKPILLPIFETNKTNLEMTVKKIFEIIIVYERGDPLKGAVTPRVVASFCRIYS